MYYHESSHLVLTITQWCRYYYYSHFTYKLKNLPLVMKNKNISWLQSYSSFLMAPCKLFWLHLPSSLSHPKLHIHGTIFWIYYIFFMPLYLCTCRFLCFSSLNLLLPKNVLLIPLFEKHSMIVSSSLPRVDWLPKSFSTCPSHSPPCNIPTIMCFYYGTQQRTFQQFCMYACFHINPKLFESENYVPINLFNACSLDD